MSDSVSPSSLSQSAPAARANWAQQLLNGLNGFGNRLVSSFKLGFILLLVCAAMALAWRFLDLYELSVRSQTVQAQIAMERHQYMMQEIKRGKSAMTSEEVRQAIAAGTASTPASAALPDASK